MGTYRAAFDAACQCVRLSKRTMRDTSESAQRRLDLLKRCLADSGLSESVKEEIRKELRRVGRGV